MTLSNLISFVTFLMVRRVLFRYVIVKLKILMGSILCIAPQMIINNYAHNYENIDDNICCKVTGKYLR